MFIDQSVSKQLRDALPVREREALEQALNDIGSEGDDVTLVVLNNRSDVNAGSDAFIKLLQYGNENQLTLSMKARNAIAIFHCRLEFEKMPIAGMTMQELVKLLNNKLKDHGYGNAGTASSQSAVSAPSAPVQAPTRSAPQPNDEDDAERVEGTDEAEDESADALQVEAKGFTKRDEDVRAMIAGVREKHGEGPYARDVLYEAIRDASGTGRGAGLMLKALVRRGYLIPEGDKYRAISPEETPVLDESVSLMGKKTPTLPDDDPLVQRQRAMADLFAEEAAKKAGLSGKKAELEAMLAQQAELERAIVEKRAEIESDEATILSDEALAEFDALLARYRKRGPQVVEALLKVS